MPKTTEKRIFLLTAKYPYGIAETFIEPEMEAAPKNIRMTIIPVQLLKPEGEPRPIPSWAYTDVILDGRPFWEYPLAAARMLFSREYRDEIRSKKKRGSVSVRDRIRVAGYLGRSRQMADLLIKKYGSDLRSGNAVIYSYWLRTSALAGVYIKEETGCMAISRAHRTDVYDGNCVYGVMPAQEKMIAGLDEVFVCSQDGQQYFQSKYPHLRDKLQCSYLGSQDYGVTTEAKQDDTFVIASCSRLVPVKRVQMIAEALKLIGDRKIRWIHIGDGPERKTVEAAMRGLPDNVDATILGNIDHDDVMQYYKSHYVDLFLNVSSSEGLPVSIMEACSFGIPAIATDAGGNREIVCPEIGDLVPVDISAEALAGKIRGYMDLSKEEMQAKRETVRKFWEKSFSASANYEKFYNTIYEKQ